VEALVYPHLAGQVAVPCYELATGRSWSGTDYSATEGKSDIENRSTEGGSTGL